MFAIIYRLDETLKAMNNDMSNSQMGTERQGGRQSLRELVNPNIMQSAPEVGDFLICIPGIAMVTPCGTSSTVHIK